ncbi:uncharacterized [Tachysurus ichikawai]
MESLILLDSDVEGDNSGCQSQGYECLYCPSSSNSSFEAQCSLIKMSWDNVNKSHTDMASDFLKWSPQAQTTLGHRLLAPAQSLFNNRS